MYNEYIMSLYRTIERLVVKSTEQYQTRSIQFVDSFSRFNRGGIGYQVSDITSTKCSFGYFSLDPPTPFAVLTVFLDNT